MNGFDDWLQDEPQESQEVNEVGDCEAYDVMVDDKLTEDKRMTINKDVIAINEALDRFSKASESIGYADGLIEGLLEIRDTTLNKDDREAYSSQIARMDYRLDISRDEQIRARAAIQKAFEHYYS